MQGVEPRRDDGRSLCRLRSVSLVVKHSQGADTLVKLYEAKLCEEDGVNADSKAIEAVMSTLKVACASVCACSSGCSFRATRSTRGSDRGVLNRLQAV